MTYLKYEGREVSSREGESVLDALLRHGINVPFSCRSGSCHVCMQQCVQGKVPEKAQRSLKPEQRELGYFLPCRCVPETDMEIAPPAAWRSQAASAASVRDADYPPADPVLWAALRDGEMLMAALQDLYERVFNDPRLSSFFEGVTRQRAIEKQYSFIRQILTGEKLYFGDRPRNAHHWMVISDELFDHRARLMLDCLRAQGLAEAMVQRFHQVEEFYRRDIVKAAPIPKMMGEITLPLDGFEELTMDVGTLCDSCAREVEPGEKVIYHMRIGKVHCSDCSAQRGATPA